MYIEEYAAIIAKLHEIGEKLNEAGTAAYQAKDEDVFSKLYKMRDHVWELARLAMEKASVKEQS